MHALSIMLNFTITNIGSEMVINILASENNFSVSDATPSLELQQINRVY